LQQANLQVASPRLPAGEPQADEMDELVLQTKDFHPDLVIGLGGGSSLDSAKALAAMLNNPGSIIDYLEGFGNKALTRPAVAILAIPTTAGTGAEATRNAVITVSQNKAKKSLRSPFLMPRIALLDPETTLSMPAELTAETGMDALTQLIESAVSRKKQPIPEALAHYAIPIAVRALPKAVENGADVQARGDMMLASLYSGMALANSGLGAAHGIAAALGAICNVPHGLACAMLLPIVMSYNLPQCEQVFARIYGELSGQTGSSVKESAESAIAFIKQLNRRIGIPDKLQPGVLSIEMLPLLVRESRGSSMQGNPVDLTDEKIQHIIQELI